MLAFKIRRPRIHARLWTGVAVPLLGLAMPAALAAQNAQPIQSLQGIPSAGAPARPGAPQIPGQLPSVVAPAPSSAGAPASSGQGKPAAQQDSKLPAPAEGAIENVRVLTLHECRLMAMEKQPAVAAAQASLAAAQARYNAICHLNHSPVVLLERDLKIRLEQACMGVRVAEAALTQAQAEAIYDVTRNYLSVLYTRQQLRMLEEIGASLGEVREAIKADAKQKLITQWRDTYVDKLDSYVNLLEARKAEAREGEARALAAVREAMGMAGDCQIDIAGDRMPDLSVCANCKELVALALSRRGEIVQAELGAEVSIREVDAQRTSYLLSKKTFASASDIHAKIIPGGEANEQYRPGALAPEMPVFMVGCRKDRVEQAHALADRACSVAEKIRELITLEAENSFVKLRGDLEQMQYLRKAAALADIDRKTLKDRVTNQDLKMESLEPAFDAGLLWTQLRGSGNEAQYHYLLDLAALERITAGGFETGLDGCSMP
jgi:outer membrane protein TolC